MANVNLITNVHAVADPAVGKSLIGDLNLRVREQDFDNWSFEVGDELEVVFVVTQVTG